MDYQSQFNDNRLAWNKRTQVHKNSDFYNLAGFKKGATSLNETEINALGNVAGKSLLHLQCHFGLDTMSWARLGATSTGVDLSDEAISLAKEINTELDLDCDFICCNVYDLKQHLDKKFDIVFTSYGTIGWLPDLDKWAAIVSHFLKPGGVFNIVDFHPALWMMDDDLEKIKYHYFNTEIITEQISGTYTDRDAPITSIEHGWNHPFSEIITALLKHSLQIDAFDEYPYSHYNCFKNLQQEADGNWYIMGMDKKMPLMYSIKASKRL